MTTLVAKSPEFRRPATVQKGNNKANSSSTGLASLFGSLTKMSANGIIEEWGSKSEQRFNGKHQFKKMKGLNGFAIPVGDSHKISPVATTPNSKATAQQCDEQERFIKVGFRLWLNLGFSRFISYLDGNLNFVKSYCCKKIEVDSKGFLLVLQVGTTCPFIVNKPCDIICLLNFLNFLNLSFFLV